jgi:hypothetical protein
MVTRGLAGGAFLRPLGIDDWTDSERDGRPLFRISNETMEQKIQDPEFVNVSLASR